MPDRIYHLDLGLFHYQIDYTRVLLKNQHGNSLVDEVDRTSGNLIGRKYA